MKHVSWSGLYYFLLILSIAACSNFTSDPSGAAFTSPRIKGIVNSDLAQFDGAVSVRQVVDFRPTQQEIESCLGSSCHPFALPPTEYGASWVPINFDYRTENPAESSRDSLGPKISFVWNLGPKLKKVEMIPQFMNFSRNGSHIHRTHFSGQNAKGKEVIRRLDFPHLVTSGPLQALMRETLSRYWDDGEDARFNMVHLWTYNTAYAMGPLERKQGYLEDDMPSKITPTRFHFANGEVWEESKNMSLSFTSNELISYEDAESLELHVPDAYGERFSEAYEACVTWNRTHPGYAQEDGSSYDCEDFYDLAFWKASPSTRPLIEDLEGTLRVIKMRN